MIMLYVILSEETSQATRPSSQLFRESFNAREQARHIASLPHVGDLQPVKRPSKLSCCTVWGRGKVYPKREGFRQAICPGHIFPAPRRLQSNCTQSAGGPVGPIHRCPSHKRGPHLLLQLGNILPDSSNSTVPRRCMSFLTDREQGPRYSQTRHYGSWKSFQRS
ncbi:hypothetical protein HBI69_140840 [Parastagonospora nodorum]|nr:hypothetical protein HBI69_140840 [Parastagonospora nodorum]